MSSPTTLRIINPLVVKQRRAELSSAPAPVTGVDCYPTDTGCQSCNQYSDACVCAVAQTDTSNCPSDEIFRGCAHTASDHAPDGTDVCCTGWGFSPGDQIDHGGCSSSDAGYGYACYGWFDFWGTSY
jgi:hypothetical protein